MLSFEDFVVQLRRRAPFELADDAGPSTDLTTLGIDSLQALELLIVIEGLASRVVPPEVLPEVRTLTDAYEYYRECCAVASDS